MKTIKLINVEFGTLKVGDKFTLSPYYIIGSENYLNMVIKPSILLDTIGSPDEHPFNVVALNDGRPRTFQAGEMVYKITETNK